MDTQKREWTGYFLPAELWSQDLSIMEMLLLVEVSSYDNKQGCYKSNKSLARRLKMSERNVSRLVSSLKDKKFISVQLIYKEGTKQVEKRVLRPLWGYGQGCHDPSRQNRLHPHVKSGEDSNTLKSNTYKDIYVEQAQPEDISEVKISPSDTDKFNQYIELCNRELSIDGGITHREFKGSAKVRSQFLARLKDGYKGRDFVNAMKNAMADKYHKETNFRYLTPEFFSREDKLDLWLNVARKKTVDEIRKERNIPIV